MTDTNASICLLNCPANQEASQFSYFEKYKGPFSERGMADKLKTVFTFPTRGNFSSNNSF